MTHHFFRPPPALRDQIDFIWVTERYPASTPRERVLPSGNLSLVIHMDDQPVRVAADGSTFLASRALVCGARTTPMVLHTEALGAAVGVQFKPGGARPFLDVQADALAERVVQLDALWGASAHTLRDQLLDAQTPAARAQRLERFLLQRVRRSLERPHALRAALAAFEEPLLASVAQVNQRTGLSPKRLLALFRDEVGLSPKAFWRVRRFRAALRDLDQGALRGAPLAAEHGYCDQAHYLREFRALSGSTPREYLAGRLPGTDHVAISG